jgi:peptidoglycan/LPS O-acetylase OafA/YrhL
MFGIPEILLGLHLNFIKGTLTADWAIHVVIYGAIISIVAAVPFWYFMTKPIIARRKRRQVAPR